MNGRIKELRTALGMTAEVFGGRLGITRSAISNIESGRRSVTEQLSTSICREFHVNEVWLRTGEGEMFEPDPESELDLLARKYTLSIRDKALVKSYMELSESQRAAVTSFIFNMVEKCREEEAAEPEPQEPSVDELVADYRRQLEEERANRGKGGVSKESAPKEGAS